MNHLVAFVKIVFGVLLLIAWLTLSFFFAAAAFGSYFDHSAIGSAIYLSPLLTSGRHLLQSLSRSYAPTKVTVGADIVADMLLTAAFISFVTHVALGTYRDSFYFFIGMVLVAAAIGVQVVVRHKR